MGLLFFFLLGDTAQSLRYARCKHSPEKCLGTEQPGPCLLGTPCRRMQDTQNPWQLMFPPSPHQRFFSSCLQWCKPEARDSSLSPPPSCIHFITKFYKFYILNTFQRFLFFPSYHLSSLVTFYLHSYSGLLTIAFFQSLFSRSTQD